LVDLIFHANGDIFIRKTIVFGP